MEYYAYTYLLFAFVLGAIIGSFLNVIICRTHTHMKITGRSKCFHCAQVLPWYELVPVFSFLFQKGRCRSCQAKISRQYIIVELVCALLFTLSVYMVFGLDFTSINFDQIIYTLYLWFVVSLFIVITAYDFRHKIIPDIFSYTLAISTAAMLVYQIGFTLLFHIPYVWALLSGPILAAPLALLWFFSRGRWMGLGDAKLMLGVGWLLGLYFGASALILAFWIGAAVSIVLLFAKGKKYSMKSEIPFGPFLILAALLVLFFGVDVFSLFM